MKVRIERLSLVDFKCDLLAVNLFEGEKQPAGATAAADKALKGLISRLIREGSIDGKLGKTTLIHCHAGLAADKLVVVGLGKKDKLDLEAIRTAASAVIKQAREVKAKRVASIVHGSGCGCLPPAESAKAVIEGSVLGVYKFAGYAKEKKNPRSQSKNWSCSTSTAPRSNLLPRARNSA